MKTIFIGLDAATWDIIEPLMNAGRLPTLEYLCKSGVSGVLNSTIPPLTPPAWTSLATGVNPGKHGIYDFMEQDEETYEIRPINYSLMKRKAIWDVFSENGKKVIIANFPMAYPPPKVNGIFISGISSPEKGTICYPEHVKKVLHKFKYRIHPEISYSVANKRKFIRHLHNLMKMRFNLYTYLIHRYKWDLFWGVFNEIDWAQHYLWKEKEILFSMYEYFDMLLGEFLEKTEKNCNILICSDHGMKEIKGEIHFNNLLMKWGYMQLNPDLGSNQKENFIEWIAHQWNDRVKKTIKYFLPKLLINFLIKRIRNIYVHYKNINWEKSQVYSYGYLGKLYLNRRNQPSAADIENLKQKILSLENPIDGEKIFSNIYQNNELYYGDFISRAPDFILIPYDWNYMIYNNISSEWFTKPKDRAADHHPEGIFIAKLAGMTESKNLDMDICDIMPNILAMHSLPIFNDLDGRIKEELYDKEISITKVKHSMRPHPIKHEIHTNKDKEEIERKLKDLGYM